MYSDLLVLLFTRPSKSYLTIPSRLVAQTELACTWESLLGDLESFIETSQMRIVDRNLRSCYCAQLPIVSLGFIRMTSRLF